MKPTNIGNDLLNSHPTAYQTDLIPQQTSVKLPVSPEKSSQSNTTDALQQGNWLSNGDPTLRGLQLQEPRSGGTVRQNADLQDSKYSSLLAKCSTNVFEAATACKNEKDSDKHAPCMIQLEQATQVLHAVKDLVESYKTFDSKFAEVVRSLVEEKNLNKREELLGELNRSLQMLKLIEQALEESN